MVAILSKGRWVNYSRSDDAYLHQLTGFVTKHHEFRAVSSSWKRNQMETLSALLALCAGNSPVTGEFPSQRPVTRSFAVFFDLRLHKRLSKQSWGWWFGTPSHSLWCHSNMCLLEQIAESIDRNFFYKYIRKYGLYITKRHFVQP